MTVLNQGPAQTVTADKKVGEGNKHNMQTALTMSFITTDISVRKECMCDYICSFTKNPFWPYE